MVNNVIESIYSQPTLLLHFDTNPFLPGLLCDCSCSLLLLHDVKGVSNGTLCGLKEWHYFIFSEWSHHWLALCRSRRGQQLWTTAGGSTHGTTSPGRWRYGEGVPRATDVLPLHLRHQALPKCSSRWQKGGHCVHTCWRSQDSGEFLQSGMCADGVRDLQLL